MATVVLVVDDDDPVRMMLARLLRKHHYTVLQAHNAPEAHAAVNRQLPGLVISDIVMPGESGIELRRTLLRNWPDLPVILISGYSADGPAEFAARTPQTWFMQKPFGTAQLMAVIDEALGEAAHLPGALPLEGSQPE